jgi:hypothetical protein
MFGHVKHRNELTRNARQATSDIAGKDPRSMTFTPLENPRVIRDWHTHVYFDASRRSEA